nr:hypothetical protein [Tanacetum cinerariifolium]
MLTLKLRENCCKRVRADSFCGKRGYQNQSFKRQELIKSSFQDIISDELKKMKETPMKSCSETLSADAETSDDMIWEYDGIHEAYQDSTIDAWEDEEDEYLARLVFENMQLNDDKVGKELWCPMCKQGELQQNRHLIFCSLCELKLTRGDELISYPGDCKLGGLGHGSKWVWSKSTKGSYWPLLDRTIGECIMTYVDHSFN